MVYHSLLKLKGIAVVAQTSEQDLRRKRKTRCYRKGQRLNSGCLEYRSLIICRHQYLMLFDFDSIPRVDKLGKHFDSNVNWQTFFVRENLQK